MGFAQSDNGLVLLKSEICLSKTLVPLPVVLQQLHGLAGKLSGAAITALESLLKNRHEVNSMPLCLFSDGWWIDKVPQDVL